ncbi:MAG: hemerythrin domain-containing protein [Acidobacteriota bacterium]
MSPEESLESLAARLLAEHRRLDELFGGFLAAVTAGDAESSFAAIEGFDEALRRHTELEEERLYPAFLAERLAAPEGESEEARRFRELRLEHVQVREVSGMIRRLLAEKRDLEGARRLAGNLARRWDAHTAREEREVLRAPSSVPSPGGSG